MPSLSFLLAFVIAGYIAIYLFLITRSVISGATGHPQYFLAAASGLVLFGISVCILRLISDGPANSLTAQTAVAFFLPYVGKTTTVERQHFLQFEAAAWSFVLAFVLPEVLNFPLRRNDLLAKTILHKNGVVGALEVVLDRCLRRRHPVMLTQSSGKVYIGYLWSASHNEREWIRINPVFSGYRNEQHEFILTTDYSWVQDLPTGKGKLKSELVSYREDFDVLVALSTITSVHPFDLRLREESAFNPADVATKAAQEAEMEARRQQPMKNPSGETPYWPDWASHPMRWDPPTVEDYERMKASSDSKHPDGEPMPWFGLSISRQRAAYTVYAFIAVAITPGWALTSNTVAVVGLLVMLATGIVATLPNPRL